jgi:hypothetical protein
MIAYAIKSEGQFVLITQSKAQNGVYGRMGRSADVEARSR